MKKLISMLFAVIFILSITNMYSQQTTLSYDVRESASYKDGILTVSSVCTSLAGSGCNMPGSVHETSIDLKPILAIFAK